MSLEAALDEREVLLERRAEERLARQEHHHHVRRAVELLPVGLGPELVHVVPHLARVRLQALHTRLLLGALLRVEKRL